MPNISTGLHIVRKRVKSGDRYYVYARRGGPLIHQQDGTRPAITAELLEKAFAARRQSAPRNNLDTLLDLYRQSPAFDKLAESTQADYRSWLTRISEWAGKVPIAALDHHDMRGEILHWRDSMAETPRAADRGVGMLATVLAWARDRNLVRENHAAGIKALHKVNRADLIWELPHWFAVAPLPVHITRAIGLAGMTGLALSDLLALQWSDIGGKLIETHRKKTGGRVLIPLYPALKTFLGNAGEGAVLRNSMGKPWTVSGFKSSWQKAKPERFDRTFHDLRGTFATQLAMRGFSDPEIASVMGWSADRIAAIRARYVDRERVVRRMAERMG